MKIPTRVSPIKDAKTIQPSKWMEFLFNQILACMEINEDGHSATPAAWKFGPAAICSDILLRVIKYHENNPLFSLQLQENLRLTTNYNTKYTSVGGNVNWSGMREILKKVQPRIEEAKAQVEKEGTPLEKKTIAIAAFSGVILGLGAQKNDAGGTGETIEARITRLQGAQDDAKKSPGEDQAFFEVRALSEPSQRAPITPLETTSIQKIY